MKALFKVPVIDGRTYSQEGAGVEYKHAQSQWVIGVRAFTPDGWGGGVDVRAGSQGING